MTDNDRRQDGRDWLEKFLYYSKPHTRSVSWSRGLHIFSDSGHRERASRSLRFILVH